MGVGKYSPTVSGWYRKDQKWHHKHCEPDAWIDRDGYDSYGYHHVTEEDRAGYTECDYMSDGKWIGQGTDWEEFVYELYADVCSDWAGKPFPWETPVMTAPVTAQYRVIGREDGFNQTFDSTVKIAGFLLGRRLSSYMLIKTDHKGDRVVDVTGAGGDVAQIQLMLDQA
jgi:hypothetical protein